MSIHAIPCRIVAKRLGRIVPSTSSDIALSFLSAAKWKNFGNIRNFSNDTEFSLVAEFKVSDLFFILQIE